ncbi:MAG TPA: hypothetical protein VNJ03_07440 [Vicinamibacterales bacterium]|nr:hypothetical protein [Vicinamibacterales bacterium]
MHCEGLRPGPGAAGWETVIERPATVSAALLADPVALGSTRICTVPTPFPLAPSVMRIQPAALDAV